MTAAAPPEQPPVQTQPPPPAATPTTFTMFGAPPTPTPAQAAAPEAPPQPLLMTAEVLAEKQLQAWEAVAGSRVGIWPGGDIDPETGKQFDPAEFVLRAHLQGLIQLQTVQVLLSFLHAASAAETERTFSKSGQLVTKLRNRLSGASTEMLVYLFKNKEHMPRKDEFVRGGAWGGGRGGRAGGPDRTRGPPTAPANHNHQQSRYAGTSRRPSRTNQRVQVPVPMPVSKLRHRRRLRRLRPRPRLRLRRSLRRLGRAAGRGSGAGQTRLTRCGRSLRRMT